MAGRQGNRFLHGRGGDVCSVAEAGDGAGVGAGGDETAPAF